LDPRGGGRGEPVAVTEQARVLEVVAAAGGGRLGVAWVEQTDAEQRVRAAIGDARGRAFGPPLELAEAEDHDGSHRGWLAASASDEGELDVLFRSTLGSCGGAHPEHRCVRFFHRRLSTDAQPRGLPLVVPEPCPRAVVGNVFAGGDWYFALCSRPAASPEPTAVTLYALRFEPQYAHAEELLEGCTPQGMSALSAGVLAVGDCDGEPHGVRIGDAGRSRDDLGAIEREARCRAGRPELWARGAERASRRLDAPVSRLEALLSSARAPDGARAAWTGEAVLVARPLENRVAIGRYQCRGGSLERTGGPPGAGAP
ncbi:MAG: hypothetical protein ACOCUS_06475, partial [Polyangiales bacterium]